MNPLSHAAPLDQADNHIAVATGLQPSIPAWQLHRVVNQ
jgi:hypothetical protein